MSRLVGLRHGIRGKFGVRASREVKSCTHKPNDRECWSRTEHTLSHAGPSLLGLAVVYTLLVLVSVISGLLLKHGPVALNPYISAEESRRFFAENPLALRVAAFFSFGVFRAAGNLFRDSCQPLAFSRCPRCRQLHCAVRRVCRFHRTCDFCFLRLGDVCTGSLCLHGNNPGTAFHDSSVWRRELCRRVWPACSCYVVLRHMWPSVPMARSFRAFWCFAGHIIKRG
jgi:hypothetical protein